MRGKLVVAVLVIGVLSAAIGYYGTLPIPEGLSERNHRQLRVTAAFVHALRFIYPYIPVSVWAWLHQLPTITPVPDFNVTETIVDEVPIIIYRPLRYDESPLSAVVWIHGGGWILGSIYLNHDMVSAMATSLGDSVIISVGYRLAPMDIFPAAIDDVTKATVWVLRHLDELNIDLGRIAVMGESAGGNLAAALSQRLTFDPQYKDLPKLRAQVLVNPLLQMFDFKTPSYETNDQFSPVTIDKPWVAQMWNYYLSGDVKLVPEILENKHISRAAKVSQHSKLVSHDLLPEEFRNSNANRASGTDSAPGDDKMYSSIADTVLNPDFAPLMRPLLAGLPEAYIVTAEFDPFRDDGILYAKRLEADGVRTTWKHYAKGMHGDFSNDLADPSSASAQGNHKPGSVIGDSFYFLKQIFEKR